LSASSAKICGLRCSSVFSVPSVVKVLALSVKSVKIRGCSCLFCLRLQRNLRLMLFRCVLCALCGEGFGFIRVLSGTNLLLHFLCLHVEIRARRHGRFSAIDGRGMIIASKPAPAGVFHSFLIRANPWLDFPRCTKIMELTTSSLASRFSSPSRKFHPANHNKILSLPQG
jgi:hypothetical protein